MHKPLVVYAEHYKALQYLMWNNTGMSIKVLKALFLACAKAELQALYHLHRYASLSCRDAWPAITSF